MALRLETWIQSRCEFCQMLCCAMTLMCALTSSRTTMHRTPPFPRSPGYRLPKLVARRKMKIILKLICLSKTDTTQRQSTPNSLAPRSMASNSRGRNVDTSRDARARNMGMIPPRATRFVWISNPSRPLLHNLLILEPREYVLMMRIPRKTPAQATRNP